MKNLGQDADAGKTHQSRKAGEKVLNARDLTCQEAQIEELLSKGESTEGETDEAQDDGLADRKSPL